MKIAIESMPPFLMGAGRFFLAGALLMGWHRAKGVALPSRAEWKTATITGSLMLLGGNATVSWAQQTIPSGVAALMVGMVPLWFALMDWLRPSGDRPAPQTFLGIALGYFGIYLLVRAKDTGGDQVVDFVGGCAVVIATMCWASGSLYARHAKKTSSRMMSIGSQMVSGGLGCLVFGSLIGEWEGFDITEVTSRSWIAFAYLLIVGSLIAFTAYSWLITVSSPSKVATYAYVNPLIAIFLGWAIADEPVTIQILLAGGIIISSVAVTNAPAGLGALIRHLVRLK